MILFFNASSRIMIEFQCHHTSSIKQLYLSDNFKMQQKVKKINLTGLFKRPPLLNLQGISNESVNLDSQKDESSINISNEISIQTSRDSNMLRVDRIDSFTEKTYYFQNSKTQKNIPKQACSRCEKNRAKKICRFCNHLQYCSSCDQQVHLVGKFSYHNRCEMRDNEQEQERKRSIESIKENDSQMKIRVSEVEKINNTKKTLTTVNISQVWREVIKNLETHFDKIIEELKQKKQDILKKAKARQDQDILKYDQCINEHQKLLEQSNSNLGIMKKSGLRQKIQAVQSRILEIQNQYQIDEINKENRYKVSPNYFQELQSAIKKLHLKNILSKNVFKNQLASNHKSKVKSSLQSAGNLSTNLSPAFKTPKNAGKGHNHRLSNFSTSGPEEYVKNKYFMADRMNEEDSSTAYKNNNKNISKNESHLAKVRSQKLFPKSNHITLGSPKTAMGKITEYFNSNKRNTKKK